MAVSVKCDYNARKMMQFLELISLAQLIFLTQSIQGVDTIVDPTASAEELESPIQIRSTKISESLYKHSLILYIKISTSMNQNEP